MKPSLDRTFRIVWLLVGGLLLLALLAGGILVAAQWIGNAGAGDAAVRAAREAPPPRAPDRAVRYGMPVAVRGTATRMVLVSPGDDSRRARGDYYGDGGRGSWVNVVFLDAAGARTLLDRPAYIRDVGYPGASVRDAAPPDSLQTWITYVMALDDTNRNEEVESQDAQGLYVSDVEGGNLRPVLRPPLRYLSHQAMAGGRMLVYALEPPAGEAVDEGRMRQRAFIYDVAAGTLAPYAALDSAVARAAAAVGR